MEVDRKVWLPALAGLLASLLTSLTGWNPGADVQGYLVVLLMLVIGYLVPPAEKDIARHLNDDVVVKAALDPDSDVSWPSELKSKL